jgi:hypothetical protein
MGGVTDPPEELVGRRSRLTRTPSRLRLKEQSLQPARGAAPAAAVSTGRDLESVLCAPHTLPCLGGTHTRGPQTQARSVRRPTLPKVCYRAGVRFLRVVFYCRESLARAGPGSSFTVHTSRS